MKVFGLGLIFVVALLSGCQGEEKPAENPMDKVPGASAGAAPAAGGAAPVGGAPAKTNN